MRLLLLGAAVGLGASWGMGYAALAYAHGLLRLLAPLGQAIH